ncbi:MAG: extracellular solute-binding protein [Acetatifactor sp.]|nr:extracellular solute-binding protein [Acetatifactor sp.]
MMKRITRFVLLCMATCLLTACHGSKEIDEFKTPESFDTSKKYEITFWAKNDTNKNQTMIYEKSIEDFQKLYPNITVNLRLYTDYGKIYNDVITNIATGTTPNVCITYPDHIATYMTGKNTVVPLDDLFANKKYGLGGSELLFDSPKQEEIVPQFLDECRIADNHYAIPYMRSTEACYVNKTYVEAMGYTLPEEVLTWDFIWEVSEAAMKKNADGTFAVNGQTVMIPFIYKSTDNMMIQILRQKGAGYATGDGRINIFNETMEDVLKTVAEHTQTGAFSTFKMSGYPANFLNAGQCLFAVDSTAGSTWMGSEAPLLDISADKVVKFETVVYPVPQYDPENRKMISQGPSVCIFQKPDDQEVLASWLFAQFLLTDEVQIAYAETEGYVPVTNKAQQTEEYKEYLNGRNKDGSEPYAVKIAASKVLLTYVEDTFVTPVFNGSASLRDAAGQMIETVHKSVRRKQTVDEEFLQKLYSDTMALYHLNPEGTGTANVKADLGKLPGTAVALLATLGLTWAGIIAYVVCSFLYERRKQSKKTIDF